MCHNRSIELEQFFLKKKLNSHVFAGSDRFLLRSNTVCYMNRVMVTNQGCRIMDHY